MKHVLGRFFLRVLWSIANKNTVKYGQIPNNTFNYTLWGVVGWSQKNTHKLPFSRRKIHPIYEISHLHIAETRPGFRIINQPIQQGRHFFSFDSPFLNEKHLDQGFLKMETVLVSGWTNPSEKYALEIGSFPQIFGLKIPKMFSDKCFKKPTWDKAFFFRRYMSHVFFKSFHTHLPSKKINTSKVGDATYPGLYTNITGIARELLNFGGFISAELKFTLTKMCLAIF